MWHEAASCNPHLKRPPRATWYGMSFRGPKPRRLSPFSVNLPRSLILILAGFALAGHGRPGSGCEQASPGWAEGSGNSRRSRQKWRILTQEIVAIRIQAIVLLMTERLTTGMFVLGFLPVNLISELTEWPCSPQYEPSVFLKLNMTASSASPKNFPSSLRSVFKVEYLCKISLQCFRLAS